MNAKQSEFSYDDIEEARQQNVISSDTADALVEFLNTRRGGFPSEEPFRLVGGFNDIFVALASLLLFVGISVWTEGNLAGSLLIVAASVGLSEYFTRRKRLRLTSILYACTILFICGHVFLGLLSTGSPFYRIDLPPFWEIQRLSDLFPVWALSAASLLTAIVGVGYWFRYRIPITVALVTGCVVLAIEFWVLDLLGTAYLRTVLFVYGALVFAFAIYWDRMDPSRLKLDSDVAFWLHLLAAPLIVNSVYTWFLLGADPNFASYSEPTMLAVSMVFVAYVVFGLVALLINRRAFIVAGLGYVIFAIFWSLNKYDSPLDNVAFALIFMGLIFLVLAVWWDPTRNFLIGLFPSSIQVMLSGHHKTTTATGES